MAEQQLIGSQPVATTPNSSTGRNRSDLLPELKLPRGGGAVSGIGEKFTATPVTGTGSMSVPIYASPGRTGVAPHLSLSYDSGSGNGPFGFGWSLNLPSITRKTDKGIPKYGNELDTFILSGAEDLVPCLAWTKEGWIPSIASSREAFGQQYRIQQYRPRVEGLFARIERWVNISDRSDTFWRSISKDNVTSWYGKTPNSRIADPGDSTRIFSWLLSETYDDKGNLVTYEYKPENSEGVDLTQSNERNRSDQTRSANRYIKKIHYGNRTPYFPDFSEPAKLPTDYYFGLVFDYGEHEVEAPIPQEQGQWSCRPDPFSSYRAAFEVRTYRRCRRVLMFHHFPDEPGVGSDCLVRSTDFTYPDAGSCDAVPAFYSYLISITQTGYIRDERGGYLKKCIPPLEFEYTEAVIDDHLREIDSESLSNLPQGIDGASFRWIDLDGEGVAGILATQSDGSWRYKPNLSPAREEMTDAQVSAKPRFGPLKQVQRLPSLVSQNGAGQQLMDLSGDGHLDLVDLESPTPGLYERRTQPEWVSFRPFNYFPTLDWNDRNLRFVDLTGDGLPDLLITESDAFLWHAGLATDGFGPEQRVLQNLDEERGPRAVFADTTETIFLADMSGDGLSDIVRVRNGEICYWPNLGYGRFGAKIGMNHAPWFETVQSFDGRRVRLADIDGSGTADVIYFASGEVQLYFNQSGNGFGPKQVIRHFPPVESLSTATAIDLLGNGTACLVWSSPLPSASELQLRYVDLMSHGKPHLLRRINNNLGAETVVTYAPSTKFYVLDKISGTPWATRIPFPVHVVERVETYDYISRNRFVTCYTYHHGYYDGVEREFRGFGRVDQYDTESFATLRDSSNFPEASNEDVTSNIPPILTRTWFHNGAFLDASRISRLLAHEYYVEESSNSGGSRDLLEDTILPSSVFLPSGKHVSWDFSSDELREAVRALRGAVLRQEVYSHDGTVAARLPYSISESNYTIEVLQPRGQNRYAVFLPHPREVIEFHYERKRFEIQQNSVVRGPKMAEDPRIGHSLTLGITPFGSATRSVSISYGRRYKDPVLSPEDRDRQGIALATYTEVRYTNPVLESDAYRVPQPAESSTYEVLHILPKHGSSFDQRRLGFSEVVARIEEARDGRHDIAYEDRTPGHLSPSQTYRRLIDRSRILFRPDDLGASLGDQSALLPLGQLQSRALPGTSFKLAFTEGLLRRVYKREGEDLLTDPASVLGRKGPGGGGYIDLDQDGNWWIPSGRMFYAVARTGPERELEEARNSFFLPKRFEDAFEHSTVVEYDRYQLFASNLQDAVGSTSTAKHNYRVLAISEVADENGNRAAAVFDALGLVAGTAVMGKVGEQIGDSVVNFPATFSEQEISSFYHADDPHALAYEFLRDATTCVISDFDALLRSRRESPQNPNRWRPAWTAIIARETHVSDLEEGQKPRLQISFSYSDGFGREIQRKAQAEPGPVVPGGPDVKLRWITSGWTIFNNKGKPVREYEPFFSRLPRGHDFEFGVTAGVSPILCYDPMERLVATLHPNHTYQKVVFDPWMQQSWDVNDTSQANPSADPHVGDFFRRIPRSEYLPTWYEQRISGALGEEEKRSAAKTANHSETPATTYFDVLGRAFLSVADNGREGKYGARTILDIEGNPLEIQDAIAFPAASRGRVVARYDYDLLQNRIHQASMEAGERWTLNDVTGKPIRVWDNRGHNFRTEYDALRRPVALYVSGKDPEHSDKATLGREVLYEKIVYGEGQPESLNLRTRVFKHFDSAGVVTNMGFNPASGQEEGYDFKGNLLFSSRAFAEKYESVLDWSCEHSTRETFSTSTRYDALNRPIAIITPDGSITYPRYNEAKLLETVAVAIRATGEKTAFVRNIDYDEKGQPVLFEYGNRVAIRYEYDRETFRLNQITSIRPEFPKNESCVQDLRYTYDAVGNITHIRDLADIHDVIFFRNQRVDPSADYTYDALYRLIEASGREQLGRTGKGTSRPTRPSSYNDDPRTHHAPLPGDVQALGNYVEKYSYDEVGNILKVAHRGSNSSNPGWIRSYYYDEPSALVPSQINNRLSRTEVSGSHPLVDRHTYDRHGNVTGMMHLERIRWDFRDELHVTGRTIVKDSGGDPQSDPGENTYYVYNAAGQRVRKVTDSVAGRKTKERFYLGNFEIYREYDAAGEVKLERETFHVMDDKKHIALVETKTVDRAAPQPLEPDSTIRYQLDNLLRSASVELDADAAVISYEEYYPYGGTSYQGGRSVAEVSLKRYRFTGKERDEETGFYYFGSRYYAPWLGRWTSPDPEGLVDGTCLYQYCGGDPVALHDPTGTQSKPAMTGLITNDPRVGALWEKAVVETLGPRFKAKSYAEVIKAFQAEVASRAAKYGGKLGSNRAAGTAINYSRRLFSQVRSKFGKLAAKEGISLKGLQVHHAFDELAKVPGEALNTTNLMFAKGNAGTVGSGHNFAHQVGDAHAAGVKNPGQKVAADLKAKGITPDVPELSSGIHQPSSSSAATATKTEATSAAKATKSEVATEVKSLVKTEVKETVEVGGKEALKTAEKTGLKEGAKVLGTKAAKFIPFVGIGVGVGLVAKDLHDKDYAAAAWDTAEAIPVVGDVVGAGHLGITIGTAANEGLGIDKVAAEHGMAVEGAAKSLGMSEGWARGFGATAAGLSAITIAPQIAIENKILSWL